MCRQLPRKYFHEITHLLRNTKILPLENYPLYSIMITPQAMNKLQVLVGELASPTVVELATVRAHLQAVSVTPPVFSCRTAVKTSLRFATVINYFLGISNLQLTIFVLLVAYTCSSLTISNGAITYNPNMTSPFDIGTVATYSCNAGFHLSGSFTRTCVTSGTLGVWTGTAPLCLGKY